ncbi:MAG: LamG domain-containing protein [Lentisphaerae bacterium]|jgi:hypothetical protein|nr:LamG domain-containing protein [Lentisphaerota bacterium]MBT4819552.1 LamG domain-containing protein [Lentisphaerota bacterium]MBT5609369.1 LamG domain-containing protein [Lentisphaerota bacterium]MBT7060781.1 LamG domain-containing protein [Lentisphaerota bacterium]MBT7843504.1 LamG domain-containing protein [Lentisphaerota bacterium]
MRSYRHGILLILLLLSRLSHGLEPSWKRPYADRETAAPDVIGLWQFDGDGPTALRDLSGNGHSLSLRGQARIIPEGKFGGCLESFPAGNDNDHPQGATAKNAPTLTPSGPFSIDVWFRLKPGAASGQRAFFLDKKNYHYDSDLPKANRDYNFYLVPVGKRWSLRTDLGFGTTSAHFASRALELPTEEWHHAAFTYDAAGTLRFFLDGRSVGGATKEGCGPVAHGQFQLAVGDRMGSTHHGFPGFLDQVRICNGVQPFFTGDLTLSAAGGRTVFERMEKDAAVALRISNDTGQALPGGTLNVVFGSASEHAVAPMPAGTEQTLRLPVDTSLRADDYVLTATYTAGDFRSESTLTVTLIPRERPNVMPVVMWGWGDVAQVADIGFTHQIRWMGYFDGAAIRALAPVPDAVGDDVKSTVIQSLEDHSRAGVGAVLKLYPGSYMARHKNVMKTHQRVDRDGTPYKRMNVCASHADVPKIGHAVGASVMQNFGHLPAVKAALVHSEVRDGTAPCFHDHDRAAFEAYSGYPIPPEIQRKTGVDWRKLKDFPPDRIIPENHPVLTYYRWFWKGGDGWNSFHSAVHQGVKSTGRNDVWTFHDPAVRVPAIWGSGGEVDAINQWTYTYPDPIKIGQAVDELFAMARGRPGQQVMKMTQMIWKRFQTTSKNTPESERAAWEGELPDAKYYTIAPDHLREAFWSKISRPVRGIMYHGWGSLVELEGNKGSYVFTNPGAEPVLRDLFHRVVKPLGPTLLQVPDFPAEVAVLESFTSQMFARCGSWGWSVNWTADAHLVLQWARLQPEIIYEETILRDGLNRFKVLVMPSCDVLTEPILARIQAFQDAGGIIVADERAPPAILPDIALPTYTRRRKAAADKAALQERALALRAELDTILAPSMDSSTPDLVLRRRRFGTTDYLFVLNDRRTIGAYVGQHGLVMEKGVPVDGSITVQGTGRTVYDLLANTAVPAPSVDGQQRISCALGPGAGNIYMVCEQPITTVTVTVPGTVRKGSSMDLSVSVCDATDELVDAVVPLEIEVTDPEGRAAEFSGAYGAAGGRADISLNIAANDLGGPWRASVRDLASGKTVEKTFIVTD